MRLKNNASLKIRKTKDPLIIASILKLDAKIFNDGSIPLSSLKGDFHYWYIAKGAKIIAFTACEVIHPNKVKHQRTAVIPSYRGRKLQKALLLNTHRYFKLKLPGPVKHITYFHPNNVASINTFFSAGYKAYRPTSYYGGDFMLYVYKYV